MTIKPDPFYDRKLELAALDRAWKRRAETDLPNAGSEFDGVVLYFLDAADDVVEGGAMPLSTQ